MVLGVVLVEFGILDLSGKQPAVVHRHNPIACGMKHQRWGVYLVENLAYIDRERDFQYLHQRVPGGRESLVARVPFPVTRFVCDGWGEVVDDVGLAGAEAVGHLLIDAHELCQLRTFQSLGRAVGTCAVEDQAVHPVGVGGGEEQTRRTALGGSVEERSLDLGRVHDGSQILNPFIDARIVTSPVGRPGATFVELHPVRERTKPVEHVPEPWPLPRHLDVLHGWRYCHYGRPAAMALPGQTCPP